MSSPLARLAASFADGLEFDWPSLARPEQLPPPGDWNTWLILAGRGFGKTRTGAEWVRANVCGSTPLARGRYRQIALIAETVADVRDVMIGDGRGPGEGSGILQVHSKDFRPTYEPSKRRLEWPNGAVANTYSADAPDQLRGPQHDAAWFDELAKWPYAEETWDQAQFGLRLGPQPRALITTTPRPIKLLKRILADPGTVVTRGRTADNAANLAPSFLATIVGRYGGTRLGRQELDAELLEDTPGALWKRSDIDATRVKPADAPTMRRVVVAIDPAVSSGENADETGIVVAGVGPDDAAYILDDRSGVFTPDGWAREAIAAYHRHKADRIVAEVNNGGDLVETVVRTVDANVAFKAVHASRGKAMRAEPIAALYEQKRVHHVGAFAQLEDQMASFTADFQRGAAGYSPDRLDALVWALTELQLSHGQSLGLLEYYRRLSEGEAKERREEGARTEPPSASNGGVRMIAPAGMSAAYGMSGRRYALDGSAIIVAADDVEPFTAAGWKAASTETIDG